MLTIVLWVLIVPEVLACAYLLVLTLLSFVPLRKRAPGRDLKFAFVVPAHNEAHGIADTVASLLRVQYSLRRVVVVADNCTDDTAARARTAGAEVLERQDEEKRGKGYALDFAFTALTDVDAVVVVDADSLVSENILHDVAAAMGEGAEAVQVDYAVRDPESWRTLLMAVAFGMFHVLRSRARETLRLSSGLRGNGMAFTTALLARVPHAAYSLVEDVEYGVALGRAGVRVHYAGDAHVYGEMVSGEASSRSQRQRWEDGRKALVRRLGWPLVQEALRKRSFVLFDLAVDVLLPPLSSIVLSVIAAVAVILFVHAGVGLLCACTAMGGAIVFYVLRGWSLSRTGARGLFALLFAPLYVAWKMLLKLRPKKDGWVRTQRKGEP